MPKINHYIALNSYDMQPIGNIYAQSLLAAKKFLDQDIGGQPIPVSAATKEERMQAKELPVLFGNPPEKRKRGGDNRRSRPMENYVKSVTLRGLSKVEYDWINGNGRGQTERVKSAIRFYLDHEKTKQQS